MDHKKVNDDWRDKNCQLETEIKILKIKLEYQEKITFCLRELLFEFIQTFGNVYNLEGKFDKAIHKILKIKTI